MYRTAFASLAKSRRFWIWEICGIIIYAIPVTIRLATGSVVLPVLSFVETPWISMYIPGNIVEKILVNAFFPGAAGAVAGEVFFSRVYSETLKGREMYLARLSGALIQTSAFTVFQLWGNVQNIAGSWGGNLFEYPTVYPINFLIASLSIFTPTLVSFLRNKLADGYRGLKSQRKPADAPPKLSTEEQ